MNVEELGKYLSEQRKEKGMSIYKLSKESGVSHSYISQLERGVKEKPSPEILKKISTPLGISHNFLMQMAGHIELQFEGRAVGNQMYLDPNSGVIKEQTDEEQQHYADLELKNDFLRKQRELSMILDESENLKLNEKSLSKYDVIKYKEFINNQEYGPFVEKNPHPLANEKELSENKEIDIEHLINSKLTYKGHVLTDEQKELYIKMARALLE
jgi:transcriptional regulator with XRE-family HTH domain